MKNYRENPVMSNLNWYSQYELIIFQKCIPSSVPRKEPEAKTSQ